MLRRLGDYPLRSVIKKLERFKISTVIDNWKMERQYVVVMLRWWSQMIHVEMRNL